MADFIIPAVSSIQCAAEVALKSNIQVLKMETRTDYDFNIKNVLRDIEKGEKEFKDALLKNLPEDEIFGIWNKLRAKKWQKLLYEENQVKPDAGEQMLKTGIRMIEEMH